jgi:hypothetical protein
MLINLYQWDSFHRKTTNNLKYLLRKLPVETLSPLLFQQVEKSLLGVLEITVN